MATNEPMLSDKDIIQNTGEIDSVTRSLEELIKVNDEMHGKVVGTLSELSKQLSKLGSATKEGRDGISSVVSTITELVEAEAKLKESDKVLSSHLAAIAKSMESLGEDGKNAEKILEKFASVADALAKGSLKDLEKYLKALTHQYKSLNSEMRESRGEELSKDIRELTNGIRELSTALSAAGTKENELLNIRRRNAVASAKIATANSEEAKSLRETELTLKELNTQLQLNAKYEHEKNVAAGSYNAYKAEVKMLTEEYHKLSEAQRSGSVSSSELVDRILVLNAKIREADATLKPYITSQNMLARVQSEIAYRKSDVYKAQREQIEQAQKELEGLIETEKESRRELTEKEILTNRLTEAEREYAQAVEASNASNTDSLNKLYEERAKYEEMLSLAQEKVEKLSGGRGKGQRKEYREALNDEKVAQQELINVDQRLAQAEAELEESRRRAQESLYDKTNALRSARDAQGRYLKSEQEAAKVSKMHEIEVRRKNKESELEARIAASVEGSYERLRAEYDLIIFKMTQMDTGAKSNETDFLNMAKEADKLKDELDRLEATMGTHGLRLTDYKGQWDGLGMSVNQLVREIPSAAYGINTLIVAWSNNLPIFFEEISRATAENKRLKNMGEQTIPVTKRIVKSLFSWMNALTLVVGAITIFGKEIAEGIKQMVEYRRSALSTSDAITKMADSMKSSNVEYGRNATALRTASNEWKTLRTEAEKNQWIKDNDSLFRQLDVSVRSINDAERIFVENTKAVTEAFKLRSMAEAGVNLATEQYTKSLQEQAKLEAVDDSGRTLQQQKDYYAGKILKLRKAIKDVEAEKAEGKKGVKGVYGYDLKREQLKDQLDAYTELYKQTKKALADAQKEIDKLDQEAAQYLDLSEEYQLKALEALKEKNIDTYHKLMNGGRGGRTPTDLEPQIREMEEKVLKEYQKVGYESMRKGFEQSKAKLIAEQQNEIKDLRNVIARNEEWMLNKDGKWKALTAQQRARVLAANKTLEETIKRTEEVYNTKLAQLEADWEAKIAAQQLNEMNLRLRGSAHTLEEEFKLREQIIDKEMEREIALNKAKTLEEQVSEQLIRDEYAKKQKELFASMLDSRDKDLKATIDNRLKVVEKGSDAELELQKAKLDIEERMALRSAELNKKSKEEIESIVEAYKKARLLLEGRHEESALVGKQKADLAEFSLSNKGDVRQTLYKLNQEKELILRQLALADAGKKDLTADERRELEARIKSITNEADKIWWDWTPESILSKMGFDESQISAMKLWLDKAKGLLEDLVDAEVEAAEKSVEAAEKRSDAFKKALDDEIDARKNGFANNVETARREYLLAKEEQRKREKLLEEAKKKQEQIDQASQISSLITASANIAKAFAPNVAAIAIGLASLWGLYAYSRIKAKQIASTTYGEGGFEMAEGGSHASGHDINLGMHNGRGKSMRIEGGEGVGIIRKRSMKRYGKQIPAVIDSLNKGTFERVYGNTFNKENNRLYVGGTDTQEIERLLRTIVSRGEESRTFSPDGTEYLRKGATTRIIRH